jgi:cell division protein FtsB
VQEVYQSVARTKKTSLIIKAVLAIAVVYLLYVFIGLQVKINAKKQQINDYNTKIAEITSENERLTGILDAEIDEEYVEKVARDMGYVNQDEKVYESISD